MHRSTLFAAAAAGPIGGVIGINLDRSSSAVSPAVILEQARVAVAAHAATHCEIPCGIFDDAAEIERLRLDAQTIQMCKMEEAAGNSGSYGRQIVYKTLATAIVSPLVGLVMDKITAMTGSINYTAPFMISNVLLLCSLISLCFIDKDIGLPKSDTMKGVKTILTDINIMVFLVMIFVCGIMFGFVETFLFVYLKVKIFYSL